MTDTSALTSDEIAQELNDLGIAAGDCVLVHSSLSSLGNVAGGAAAVVDALLAAVGNAGTVVVPTLTGDEHVGPAHPVVFSRDTPSWTGAIPENLRVRGSAVRSLHPTHSVAAIGADAIALVTGHEDCVTPCGVGSPYVRLTRHPRGKILLLGVGHESNTTLHAVEELAGADYHLQEVPVHAIIGDGDRRIERTFWAHAYGTPRAFPRIAPLLRERGAQRDGRIGNAQASLIDAAAFVDISLAVLRARPNFLVDL